MERRTVTGDQIRNNADQFGDWILGMGVQMVEQIDAGNKQITMYEIFGEPIVQIATFDNGRDNERGIDNLATKAEYLYGPKVADMYRAVVRQTLGSRS